MRIIAVSSQKGGSGKTTIAGHLALAAEAAGAGPVGLIDTDPQRSLTEWFEARRMSAERDPTLACPAFADASGSSLTDSLNAMRDAGMRLVVVDTPPAITRAIEAVVQQADLVIIPTRPSPHDLRAAGATVDLVEHCGKPLIFVVNAATARARLTGEAAIALSQHGTVAPQILHNRQDFAASMIDGRTVIDSAPKGRSTTEVMALWTYMADRLARLPMRTGFRPATATNGAARGNFGRRPLTPSTADPAAVRFGAA